MYDLTNYVTYQILEMFDTTAITLPIVKLKYK